jgi:hypothetical protein
MQRRTVAPSELDDGDDRAGEHEGDDQDLGDEQQARHRPSA